MLEAELQDLRDKRAEEARGRQAEEDKMKAREDTIKDRDAELTRLAEAQVAERGRLETMEQTVRAEKVELDAKAKVLAEDRVAFALLEERSRAALKTLYDHSLEKLLATDEDVPAQLLPYLVEALEEVMNGVRPVAEVEARVLSSAALTCVLSHLYLHDPNANLDDLLDPVENECFAAAAEAVKGQVEALLGRFRAFASAPTAGDGADPAAPSGGTGGATTGVESLAGDGNIQG